jgi:hypothetical protein
MRDEVMYPSPLPENYFGDQNQESATTDDEEEYDDSYQDEDELIGSPAGESEV